MLCHGVVTDKPGDLSVTPSPGKLAGQLKSPFGDSCFKLNRTFHETLGICQKLAGGRGVGILNFVRK